MLKKRIISFLTILSFFCPVQTAVKAAESAVISFDFEEYAEGESFKSGKGWNVSAKEGDSFIIETDPVSNSKALKFTKGAETAAAFAEYTDSAVSEGIVEVSYDVRIASATKYFNMIGAVRNSKWKGFTPEIKQSGLFDASKAYSANGGWIVDFKTLIGYEYATYKHILDFSSGVGEFLIIKDGKIVKSVTYNLWENAGEYKYLGFAAETDNRFSVNAWDAVYDENDRYVTAENNPDGVMYIDNIKIRKAMASRCDFENEDTSGFVFDLKDCAEYGIETDPKSGSKAMKIRFFAEENEKSSNIKYVFPKTDTGKIEAEFDIRFENNSAHFSSLGNLCSSEKVYTSGLRQVTDSFWKDANTWLFIIGNDEYFHIKQVFNFETGEYSFVISQDGKTLKSFYDIYEDDSIADLYALDFNIRNMATINGSDEGDGVYWIDNISVKQSAAEMCGNNGRKLSPYENSYSIYYDMAVFGKKSDVTVKRNGEILDSEKYEVYFDGGNKRVRLEFVKDNDFYDSGYQVFLSSNLDGINGVSAKEAAAEFYVGAAADVEISGVFDSLGKRVYHIKDAAGETVSLKISCIDADMSGFSGFAALKDGNGRLQKLIKVTEGVSERTVQIPSEAQDDWYMELYAINPETMVPYMIKKQAFSDNIVYVEKGFKDGDGSFDFPFSSIEEAMEKALGDTVIIIKDEIYRITSPIILKNEKGYNIKITSLKNTVIDTRIDLTNPRKVNEKERARLKNGNGIQVYELKNYGIDSVSELCAFGHSKGLTVLPEQVYENDIPMSLAKYPNDGSLTIKNVYNSDGQSGEMFDYSGADTSSWQDKSDIWLFGYPTYSWAHEFVKIKSVSDTKINADTGDKGKYRWGQSFCIVNVFEELDAPGEYYIDRDNLILYVYPSSEDSKISLATYKDELIKAENTSGVSFKNIGFAGTRGTVVYMDSCENISFDGCNFTDGGVACIKMKNCRECDIQNCEISYIGSKGIVMTGLDRSTMEKANNRIVNNKIHDFAYYETTYNPAVFVESIGNRIAHNEIYNSNHMAISAYGNFNVYEYNYIHDVLKNVTDSGAVYTGRTWCAGGNIIRYNLFKNLSKSGDSLSNNAVYFDDAMFGGEVYGNIFENVQTGVFVHGGRCNKAWNNIFINVEKPIDVRHIYSDSAVSSIRANAYLALMNLKFKKSFPELLKVIDDEPTEPKYNKAYKNALIDSGSVVFDESAEKTAEIYDNAIVGKDIFKDGYTIDSKSYLFDLIPGFEMIDAEKIGNI